MGFLPARILAMRSRDNSSIWKRPIESRRRPTTPIGGLRVVAYEAFEAVALPLAFVEYYLHCFARVFVVSNPENDPYLRPWKLAKDTILLLVLVAVYLQYHFMNVMVEIASLPFVAVHV